MLLSDSAIATGHVGISIYDPEKEKFLFRLNDEKKFLPASTTKLFTLYAGMKYLGDSLAGLYYSIKNDTLFVQPSADPTFLHPDFQQQPVHQFLNNSPYPVVVLDNEKYPDPYGKGWSIDDINQSYLPQRSAFPVCGNLLHLEWRRNPDAQSDFPYTLSEINSDLPDFSILKKTDASARQNNISRIMGTHHYEVTLTGNEEYIKQDIPFETNGIATGFHILKNSLYRIPQLQKSNIKNHYGFTPVYSQSSDSVFSLMMHHSDNFYAEQILLMVGDRLNGALNTDLSIDTLLKNDFKDIPHTPRWVDGSGLSRYNLFSPQDEIYIMKKLVDSFGISRIEKILPTGGEGTLKNLWTSDAGFIYAKTGSMSNIYCISGLLHTSKGKTLYFSIMVNNFIGKSAAVKKAIENFVHAIREIN